MNLQRDFIFVSGHAVDRFKEIVDADDRLDYKTCVAVICSMIRNGHEFGKEQKAGEKLIYNVHRHTDLGLVFPLAPTEENRIVVKTVLREEHAIANCLPTRGVKG